MCGLVSEHRPAGDIPDRVDVGDVRAPLRIDRDLASVSHVHARLLEVELVPAGTTAHGDEHTVIRLGIRCVGTLERDLDSLLPVSADATFVESMIAS